MPSSSSENTWITILVSLFALAARKLRTQSSMSSYSMPPCDRYIFLAVIVS